MDKYVIKRIKITYGIFTSLLLVSLLCLAFCSLLLVYSSDNIAYANSTNGIVEDNLISINDFSQPVSSTTASGFNIWRTNAQGSLTYNSNGYNVFGGTGNGQLWFYFDTTTSSNMVGNTYTLSLYTNYGLNTVVQSNISLGNYSGSVISYSNGIQVHLRANNNANVFVQFLQGSSSSNTLNIYWIKLEFGSSFTGYVSKDYVNYGYDQGVKDGSNSTAYINSGYVLDKTVLLSDIENGSLLTINNINYRFQGNTVLDNYFQTNVINSWPLGANGDTSHRYLGFLIADDLYKFSAIQISIIRDGAGYLYYSGDGLTPKIVDLSSLSPVSSYPFNYLNQSTYMDTYVIYASDFTNVYYLTYIDTSSSTAGDTLFFNTINIYSNLDNSSWYDRGIETGKSLGFNEGYNKGYQEGSNYSGIPFYNMFGAIFDVPVQTINGLLDFNILGVNMKGFILGLISLCIILFILKIVFK